MKYSYQIIVICFCFMVFASKPLHTFELKTVDGTGLSIFDYLNMEDQTNYTKEEFFSIPKSISCTFDHRVPDASNHMAICSANPEGTIDVDTRDQLCEFNGKKTGNFTRDIVNFKLDFEAEPDTLYEWDIPEGPYGSVEYTERKFCSVEQRSYWNLYYTRTGEVNKEEALEKLCEMQESDKTGYITYVEVLPYQSFGDIVTGYSADDQTNPNIFANLYVSGDILTFQMIKDFDKATLIKTEYGDGASWTKLHFGRCRVND